MSDITQNINYNYKTNVQTMTRYHDQYNASLGRVQRTTQRLTRTIGSKDKYALRGEKIAYRNVKATNAQTGAMNKLGGSMGGLALRFVGYQMVLNQVMGAQQKLIQWVSESIGKFREFEKSMAEVSTIIGDLTTGQMPGLTAGVESLSVRFGKSATDMAKGLYDILSAAFDADDAMRLLTTATKASIAGLADVSTSVDIFTSVLNAYGMSVSQAQHISDVFFQTIRRGKLVFEDLASAIGYVTPIAAAAGVAFDEVAAILATVTRMGLHVDMASRGLALTIQSIVSPTQQAADAAKKYGVDMSGLALRVKGLTGFMKDLNTAVDTHGGTILPEMIRNMRSLRVVMAVTSDEGIAGMTTDLNLMTSSAGQTELAMTKMTNISQMQVDILANSMEHLERRIGDAWSGVDIWWKKTQLWWGSLISGGDANKALKDFEDRIGGLNSAYLALFKTQTSLAGKGTLMSELMSPDISSAFDIKIPKNMPDAFARGFERLSKMMPVGTLIDNLVPWDEINQYMELEGKKRRIGAGMVPLLVEQMELEAKTAKYDSDMGSYAGHFDTAGATPYVGKTDDETRLDAVNNLLDTYRNRLEELAATQESLQPAFDYMSAGLDDLSQSLSAHQTNIMELQNAIKGLKHEVKDTYTAMSGQTFTGKLDWQIETKKSETELDRFSQFSNMAIKYGDEFSSIEWVNEDIWDAIGGIEDYDGSMEDIIDTLYGYSEASEKAAEISKKFKDENDELVKAIKSNNLEIMKLQLNGMMRRRGLSRSEQKAIKKIEIENAQIRIDQMENAIELEDELGETHIDDLKDEYDAAKKILDEYTDRAKFNLYLLKDIRDDEIHDLEESYNEKILLLTKYTQWEKEEHAALLAENEAYVGLLRAIAERPETAEMYKELYGINATDEAIAALKRLREFQESSSSTPPAATPPSGGGGTPPTPPTPPKDAPESSPEGEDDPTHKVKRSIPMGKTLRVFSTSGETKNFKYSTFPKAVMAALTDYKVGKPLSWKRGTYNVPKDMDVRVHRYEKIIPAGDSTKAGNDCSIIIQNLTIDVKEIAELNDIEKLGALLSAAKNSRVLSKGGKTKFRSR